MAETSQTPQGSGDSAKQARYDELSAKFDAGTATTEEIFEQARIFFELHPDEKHWSDNRTPAEIWPNTGTNKAQG